MPVIHVRALPPGPGVDLPRCLGRLCQELAALWGLPARQVWATFAPLAHYVEGDQAAAGQPGDSHPPLAELQAFEGRSPAQVEAALTTLAQVLVEELGLAPGNAFVTYRELASGQVYTGGAVRHRSPPAPAPPLPGDLGPGTPGR